MKIITLAGAAVAVGLLSGCAVVGMAGLALPVVENETGNAVSGFVAKGCDFVFWGDGTEPCPTPAVHNGYDQGEGFVSPSGKGVENDKD